MWSITLTPRRTPFQSHVCMELNTFKVLVSVVVFFDTSEPVSAPHSRVYLHQVPTRHSLSQVPA
jgi:hypothetical protein